MKPEDLVGKTIEKVDARLVHMQKLNEKGFPIAAFEDGELRELVLTFVDGTSITFKASFKQGKFWVGGAFDVEAEETVPYINIK